MQSITFKGCDEGRDITIEWEGSSLFVNGIAYFHRDDMEAEMKDGIFERPLTGAKFRFFPPSPFVKNGMAGLEKEVWVKIAWQ